ncbi:malate dehydrogenase (quinone) [Subtercola lobariae]|uniref:Probable malate:quinone oxidoreductase n=1 Tax=Subtercola lobariae TaxID=1588641 RepID=A0A917B3Z1_9MICO|nr:malate dehydrogenase (quinone) [Subtercola lobariae]GGF21838.1 putative malate:quinone oxidoreductase [Subtercola lobariae]
MPTNTSSRVSGVETLDVVLIGGGIMSATLAALFAKLQPDWSVRVYERLDDIARESSDPWNNAGTGHSGLCELNYMPDPAVSKKTEEIAQQFHLSRQFWAALAASGDLPEPSEVINPTPHMDLVFGERDVTYLKKRHETLSTLPLFSAMEFSDDPAKIAEWAPLTMAGRTSSEPVAATRYVEATDVNFGALTRALLETSRQAGGEVELNHNVDILTRQKDNTWLVSGQRGSGRHTNGQSGDEGRRFTVRARFVFVGAGGYALKLLQKAHLPEVRGYGVFPIGAEFLRCDNPEIVAQHDAKIYGQAANGAPPMSVPHLDKRVIDGKASLLFGPYATFSTKLLKHGKLTDLFSTVKPDNALVLAAAGLHNLSLVKYLVSQLLASRTKKFSEITAFYPEANPADWYPIQAGQRAQLIKPHATKVGELTFGTELVTGGKGTIAGLLGASPGASTAVPIMLNLLKTCFTDEWDASWSAIVDTLVPGLDPSAADGQAEVDENLKRTGELLHLS